MQSEKIIRVSNFELLRILLIIFVIILHYNGISYNVLEITRKTSSLNFNLASFFEAIAICAVNTFILISGYFLCNKNQVNIRKAINIFVVVIFYSLFIYLIELYLGDKTFSIKSLIGKIIPVNYYAWLYGAMFILCPFLNLIFDKLNKKQIHLFILIITILFCIIPTVEDFVFPKIGITAAGISPVSGDGNQAGYTLINFILLYYIGGYINHEKINLSKSVSIVLFFILGFCVYIFKKINQNAFDYCNFFVILESVMLFLFFKNLEIKSRIINYLAKTVWGVFNLHFFAFSLIKKVINMEDLCAGSCLRFLVFSLIIIFAAFCISVIFDIVFSLLLKPVHILINKIRFLNYNISLENNQEHYDDSSSI